MKKKILDQLESLIAEGDVLRDAGRDATAMKDVDRETYFAKRTRWVSNCTAVLRFANLEPFAAKVEEVEESRSYEAWKVTQVVAHLASACDMIRSGFTGKLVHLVHAEFSDSLLDQADQLLASTLHIPAAVLARIVVERWLRDESDRNGIPNFDDEKASVLNDQLKKLGVFSVPKWRQVQACLDVGNSAAHGKTTEFTFDDVRRAVDFARVTCL